jgi:ribose transport system substrate-binding protein
MILHPPIPGLRIYGVGGSESVREAIQAGRLQAALFPRCDLVGRTAVEWAHQYLSGERGMPESQPVTPALVTVQNVDQYRDYGYIGPRQ